MEKLGSIFRACLVAGASLALITGTGVARAALDETTPDGGPPPSAASEPPEGAESEGFLVRLEPGVGTEDAEHLLDGTGAEIETESVGTGYVHITSSDAKAAEVLERLSESQLVETAEPNLVRRPAAVPDDPYYASNQAAYFRDAGIPAAWDVVTGADNLVLAVLDSGVDLDHPDLAGRLVPGWDVVDDDSRPDDDHGHGTMVAGVAAARTGNGRGVAGVAWRGSIMPVKVMSSEGFATDADVAEGIVWATDHGADVINLSLAAPGSSTALQSAVDYALAGDVVVVAAAGNDASSVPNWPAAARGVIAVGAVDRSGARAAFSSFGSWVDLVAPGVELATTANDGGESYALADGTSFASPLVAGVALLVRAYDPGAGPAAVADRLVRSATDRGAPGPDPYYGAGVVNAAGAVARAATDPPAVTHSAPPPAPAPRVVPPLGVPASPGASSGYWMLTPDGAVLPFGRAAYLGAPVLTGRPGQRAVDLTATSTGRGYWVLTDAGTVYAYGDAARLGGLRPGHLLPGEEATSLSATPWGRGYWIFTTKGRVFDFGNARRYGDMGDVVLNGPVLDSVPTPSGRGYYMVASDGGIFTFGDARFAGSMGGRALNAPVRSLVPHGDGHGYWLVAGDGGLFAFDAPFRGSMGGTPLNAPVTGMVAFGDGYLMVATDGGVFNFSDRAFAGSTGDRPPPQGVSAIAAYPR